MTDHTTPPKDNRKFVIQTIAYNKYPRIEGGIQSYNNPEIVPITPHYTGTDGLPTQDLALALLVGIGTAWYLWAKQDPQHYKVLEVEVSLKEGT